VKAFRRGCVVGKFAPLHCGHELLVRSALEACEEVVLVSWVSPELPGYGPDLRQRWLETLFPTARVLVLREGAEHRPLPTAAESETSHRRFVGEVCRHRLGVDVDAVFTSEGYGDGFADELTRFYRETDAAHPAVRHVSVDPERRRVPISASSIRSDVHAHRRWLPPTVYASFIERVVLLGGESSGKSTLAEALGKRFATAWVPEYGRELWEAKGGELVFEDLLAIGVEQIRREEAALAASQRWLFCDTSPLTTLFYSLEMFGRADPRLEALAERTYHHVFLCAPDFEFVQDGTRREPEFRERQDAWYVAELGRRGVAWSRLSGSVAERVERVSSVLCRAPQTKRST